MVGNCLALWKEHIVIDDSIKRAIKFNPRFCEPDLEKNSEVFVCFLRIVWLLRGFVWRGRGGAQATPRLNLRVYYHILRKSLFTNTK